MRSDANQKPKVYLTRTAMHIQAGQMSRASTKSFRLIIIARS